MRKLKGSYGEEGEPIEVKMRGEDTERRSQELVSAVFQRAITLSRTGYETGKTE